MAGNPKVIVTQYKRGGKFGFLTIKAACNECDLTTNLLKKMMEEEFKDNPDVVLEIKPWLDNIFFCLKHGVLHAPAIMVNGTLVFQFSKKKPLYNHTVLVDLITRLLQKS